jgi:hypothetical protein
MTSPTAQSFFAEPAPQAEKIVLCHGRRLPPAPLECNKKHFLTRVSLTFTTRGWHYNRRTTG